MLSSDTTVVLGAVTLADEELAADDLAGGVLQVLVGLLPASADLDAFHDLGSGAILFSLDVPALLGGTSFLPADIVRFDGVAFTKEIDAFSAGIPPGVNVDAVAAGGGGLLVSFDTTVALAGTAIADEDLVHWNGSAWTAFFDGSAAGVPAALDLDGADLLSNGHLLVSFDGSGVVGGVGFADEDALELDPVAATWMPAYDGSILHPAWVASDLDALAAVEGQPPPPKAPGPAGSLRFSIAVYSIAEPDGFAAITVQRVGGTDGTVAVNFTTGDGSAEAGNDYAITSGIFVWADGDGADRVFDVPIVDDVSVEAPETVNLILSNPAGGAVLGDPSEATLTILDDEVTVPAIPTLGHLGLVAFGLLLAAAGLAVTGRSGSA